MFENLEPPRLPIRGFRSTAFPAIPLVVTVPSLRRSDAVFWSSTSNSTQDPSVAPLFTGIEEPLKNVICGVTPELVRPSAVFLDAKGTSFVFQVICLKTPKTHHF